MLDVKSKLVLKFINKECGDGSYKIIETSDIISCLPSRFKMDGDGVEQIIEHLQARDFISVKYNDDTMFCVSMLPSGRLFLEEDGENVIHKRSSKKNINYYILFFMMFLSSLIASTVVALVFRFLF